MLYFRDAARQINKLKTFNLDLSTEITQCFEILQISYWLQSNLINQISSSTTNDSWLFKYNKRNDMYFVLTNYQTNQKIIKGYVKFCWKKKVLKIIEVILLNKQVKTKLLPRKYKKNKC